MEVVTKKRATIRDVASRAGVSVTTVSRVINGVEAGQVRASTKQRILRAMAELDYAPAKAARDLRRHTTHVLALLVPDISNPFFSLLARGVQAAGAKVGYSTLICDSDNDVQEERQHMSVLLREDVDGVILVPVGEPDRDSIERLARRHVRIVTADRRTQGIPYVEADNVGGSRSLAQHILECGYRRVAYIGGPEDISTAEDRLRGFLEGFSCAGVTPVSVRHGDFTYASGVTIGKEILARRQVDAIVAGNDLMAIGVLHAAAASGRRAPEDIGVAGFDDIQSASLASPRLTTVKVPFFEIGQHAARSVIAGAPPHTGPVCRPALPVDLVVGDSTRQQSKQQDKNSTTRVKAR